MSEKFIEGKVANKKELFFFNEEEIAYDDEGNVYDVYKSENTHKTALGKLGYVRLIVSGEEVLYEDFPFLSVRKNYTIETTKYLKQQHDLYKKVKERNGN